MSKRNKALFISSAIGSPLVATTNAAAHTVKTSSNVAATFHLEPSHNPKAGEPATVWFALTKAGGKSIPLSDCDCQLALKQGKELIETLPLTPITAEQYKDIPGSEVVFPKVGIYQLAFSGKAKDGKSFQPFELNYDVTVQPGTTIATTPSQTATEGVPAAQSSAPGLPWLLPIVLIGGAISLTVIVCWLRGNR
ncbi:hypothetical protein IQ266_05185 [filamentous cyanobacterium LEGE 11480]|uniref:Uncharacterized protein n=1 Tax=Romeriopsis navalis LEGE 11480 TaxID=2777977 RepID=A0A928VMC6_9CYAN|nr:hypothetical protein [Romeriopsis navalis]MBE9029155.1 hypothetical protein [Romeriopsis navalis LEGE 11480]